MSRLFAGALLNYQIPLRGAISCERFFADFGQRMFFGRALVEAYQFGEGQDWIGLLLCPSAARRMDEIGSWDRIRRYYRQVEIPWKRGRRPTDAPSRGLACLLGSWLHPNWVVDQLEDMLSRCCEDSVRSKYTRTLAFLRSSGEANG